MYCIPKTSQLYKDLDKLTNNNEPLVYYIASVINMYQNDSFITQNRFQPASGKIMYTIPKIIMEDSIAAWMQGVGRGFKKDLKTKEKFEQILQEHKHDDFIKVKEFDKVIIVQIEAPDPGKYVFEEMEIEDFVNEIEESLTSSEIDNRLSEEMLLEQAFLEEQERSIFTPETKKQLPGTQLSLFGLDNTQSNIKPGVQELFDSNPELANQVYQALGFNNINESEITYTDENGKPCAAMGLKPSKFQKGGKWEIIKEFKGKSHAQGGIDIEIGKGGIKMSNKQGKFEAKFGLVIAANGLVMGNSGGEDNKNPPNKKKLELNITPPVIQQDKTRTYHVDQAKLQYEALQAKPKFTPKADTRPVIKADTRTDYQRKVDQEYTDAVTNPSLTTQIGEAFQKPLRWFANPVKAVGDISSAVAPKSSLAKDLPNTNEDVFEYRKKQLNPYTSAKEKVNNMLNEARDLTINSLINVGTMELGFALPRQFVTPSLNNLFQVGSKANFAADLLQLSKTDLDKVSEGDMKEIGNLILNSASLISKLDNFDANTVYNNIKNWKTLSKADKIDTYKDIFNISQSINQQTQRE
jgi:hypothetical protein